MVLSHSSKPVACAFVLLHEDMHLLQDGWTTLMVASVTGNVECVELLLDGWFTSQCAEKR